MLNKKEFSDVTFMVEGKPFYGHKIIISQLSEKFKAMFAQSQEQNGGFIESKMTKIKIDNVSYLVFNQIMNFLYSGKFELGEIIEQQIRNTLVSPSSDTASVTSSATVANPHLMLTVDYLIDFLRVADEYLLEEVKNHCQNELI